MSFAVQSDHGDYLRDLQQRAQRLLEMASETSSSSSHRSNRQGRSRGPSRIQPNFGRQLQSNTVSRRRLDEAIRTYPSVEDSNQKTFPQRNAAQRIHSQERQIEELERQLDRSREDNHRLNAEIKALRSQLGSGGHTRIEANIHLEEELQRFKRDERQRLRENLEKEVEHWTSKIKQTEKKYRGEMDKLMAELDRKESERRSYAINLERQKHSHRKLIDFVKHELPRLNELLTRGVELVENEIVHRTNPHLA